MRPWFQTQPDPYQSQSDEEVEEEHDLVGSDEVHADDVAMAATEDGGALDDGEASEEGEALDEGEASEEGEGLTGDDEEDASPASRSAPSFLAGRRSRPAAAAHRIPLTVRSSQPQSRRARPRLLRRLEPGGAVRVSSLTSEVRVLRGASQVFRRGADVALVRATAVRQAAARSALKARSEAGTGRR